MGIGPSPQAFQAQLLSAVHPSWLDDFDPALARRAMGTALGCRTLIRHLGEAGIALVWVGHDRRALAQVPVRPGRVRRLLLELGVRAYALPIREVVDREPARRLRRVLGSFYAIAVGPAARTDVLSAAQAGEFRIRLSTALATRDEDVVGLLVRQGQREVYASASAERPALAEWVRLVCAKAPKPTVAAAVLSAETVAQVQQRHMQLEEDT